MKDLLNLPRRVDQRWVYLSDESQWNTALYPQYEGFLGNIKTRFFRGECRDVSPSVFCLLLLSHFSSVLSSQFYSPSVHDDDEG